MSNFSVSLLQDILFFSIPVIIGVVVAGCRNRSKLLWGLLSITIVPLFVLVFLPKKTNVRRRVAR